MIHSEDVRQHLLDLGLDRAEIAGRSSQTDEIEPTGKLRPVEAPTCAVPRNHRRSRRCKKQGTVLRHAVRSLSATHNQNAMTQLVGRILRQPDATFTSDATLNESYVFCYHAKTKDVIEAIKLGLEKDGMADVAGQVRKSLPGVADGKKKRTLVRREQFKKIDIYLPLVNWVEKSAARPLEYERDILYRLDWSRLDVKSLAERLARMWIRNAAECSG